MTSRGEILIVLLLLAWCGWCLDQHLKGREAMRKKIEVVDTLVDVALMNAEVTELHDQYSRLTHETFDNNG
jgi:hypothetical protein